jgi:hypothetical protein
MGTRVRYTVVRPGWHEVETERGVYSLSSYRATDPPRVTWWTIALLPNGEDVERRTLEEEGAFPTLAAAKARLEEILEETGLRP